jgi:hypothetical protein
MSKRVVVSVKPSSAVRKGLQLLGAFLDFGFRIPAEIDDRVLRECFGIGSYGQFANLAFHYGYGHYANGRETKVIYIMIE